jgi:hypothetical protein
VKYLTGGVGRSVVVVIQEPASALARFLAWVDGKGFKRAYKVYVIYNLSNLTKFKVFSTSFASFQKTRNTCLCSMVETVYLYLLLNK